MFTRLAMLATGSVVSGSATAVKFSDVWDIEIITTLIESMKSFTQLFTIFPLNLLLIGGPICGVIFGIWHKAKKASTGRN